MFIVDAVLAIALVLIAMAAFAFSVDDELPQSLRVTLLAMAVVLFSAATRIALLTTQVPQ